MLSRKVKAQAQFLTWLGETHPQLYDAVVNKIMERSQANQLGQFSFTGATAAISEGTKTPAPETESLWSKIVSGVAAVGTTYLSLKNQRDALKINVARAEQGLPPIDITGTTPVLRTQIDLDPSVVRELTATAGLQMNKLLLWGGAALALFFIVK